MDNKLNFLLVGAFWGITNPFLKRSLKGMDEVKKNSHINQIFADLYFLIFNWKYLIPFLIANCGSVIYYFTLQKTDLTVAVPFSNSLAFIFTAVTGWMLGEQKPKAAVMFLAFVQFLSTSSLDKRIVGPVLFEKWYF